VHGWFRVSVCSDVINFRLETVIMTSFSECVPMCIDELVTLFSVIIKFGGDVLSLEGYVRIGYGVASGFRWGCCFGFCKAEF